MTSPTVARRRSHSRDHNLSIVTLSCGWLRPFRSTASRDFTGQGPRRGQLASARRLSPRSLAGRASPQPDRLGHLLSPPVSSAGWSRLRRGRLPFGSSFTSVPDGGRRSAPRLPGFRFRGDPLGQGRLTHSPAKGSALRCARGAFRCWTTPAGGSPCLPQAVPSLWSNEGGRLFDPRTARAFDEASRHARARSCVYATGFKEPGAPSHRPQRLRATSAFGSIRGLMCPKTYDFSQNTRKVILETLSDL
jgi:hypothetical protein